MTEGDGSDAGEPQDRSEFPAAGRTDADSRSDADRELEERLRRELDPHLEVLRLLGRGSAACVFLAREPGLRRLVALKVLLPELAGNRKARLRFQREAQSAARIAHPNVVTLYRVGALSDDLPYLVMQYIRGRSLAERLEAEGPFRLDEVRRILADVASALADAHRLQIVHRDVKPANVLYEEATGRNFLTDFGIAAIVDPLDAESTRLTTRGRVVGDPRYRSPEQLRGEELTELADVYGLGLLGYELLTGESPYDHGSTSELVAAHLKQSPRPLRAIRPDIDPGLETLLQRCLEKVPAQRPRAADVVRRLTTAGETRTDRAARESEAHYAVEETVEEPPHDEAPVSTEADPGAARDRDVAAEPDDGPDLSEKAADSPQVAEGSTGPPEVAEELDVAVRPPENVIRFHVLGGLDLVADDGRRHRSVLAQPKRVALLAYLAVGSSRGFKRRDSLLGVFWPEKDQERARHSLRQALYVLRRALGSDVIESRGDEEVGIREVEMWSDAVAFERAVDEGKHEEALEWYAGELLPGFFISDAPEFERWLDSERQRLRRLASDAAWTLAKRRESEENAAGAAHWARRAMELAPWDESGLCRLIQVLARVGDRAGAIRAYEQFAERLQDEYGTEPAPETRNLIRRVRDE